MKHLHDALPKGLRATHAEQSKDLLSVLQNELTSGDIVLIKGSHGSHMYELVKTLKEKAPEMMESMHAV